MKASFFKQHPPLLTRIHTICFDSLAGSRRSGSALLNKEGPKICYHVAPDVSAPRLPPSLCAVFSNLSRTLVSRRIEPYSQATYS